MQKLTLYALPFLRENMMLPVVHWGFP